MSVFTREAKKVSGAAAATPAATPDVDVVTTYVSGTAYKSGDTVIKELPSGGKQLYQCITTAASTTADPAADVAASGGNWRQLTFPTDIAAWDATKQYYKGDLVSYSPSGALYPGLYKATGAAPAVGAAPLSSAGVANSGWAPILSPGQQVIFDSNITNPAAGAVAVAPAATITAMVTNDGTPVGPLSIPVNRRYRVRVSDPRPAVAGASMPADCHVGVFPRCVEVLNLDGTVTLTITPRWECIASAAAATIAAIAANTLTVRLTVELE